MMKKKEYWCICIYIYIYIVIIICTDISYFNFYFAVKNDLKNERKICINNLPFIIVVAVVVVFCWFLEGYKYFIAAFFFF